jgi:transposase
MACSGTTLLLTGQKRVALQIIKRKWRCIGDTPRKSDGSIEKQVLDWNPQGVRRSGRPKQSWRRTVVKEATKCKTWSEVKTESDGAICS